MTDLDRYLTDDLVERTMRALYTYEELEHPFESLTRHDLGWLEGQARASLSAVLPDIIQQAKEEAWDEGYIAGHEDARSVQPTYPQPTLNPYADIIHEEKR